MPDSVTQILNTGPPGTKLNIAVIGDGFAQSDQTAYDNKVKDLLIDGVYGHDYFYEDIQAFNIYKVNLISNHSGVSQRVYNEQGTPNDPSDDTIQSTNIFDTALGYIYSGSWAHGWMEDHFVPDPNGGPDINDTSRLLKEAINKWVPDAQLVVVILNEAGFGGHGYNGSPFSLQVVTSGSSWDVVAHEFGHELGGLGDEYCNGGAYTGDEAQLPDDLTTNIDRSTIKWNNFIDPVTPVPTGLVPTGSGGCAGFNQGIRPAGWSDDQDVGLFEGGGTNDTGIFRPVINCRMRGNLPPYCPVCYTKMKSITHAFTRRTFLKCYAGDFDGDGKDDLLVHNDNSIMIYRSNGSQLDVIFSAAVRIPGSWQFKPNDQLYVADFNGDGKDEVVVYNSVDWAKEYLGLLADDGNNGLALIARYDDSMPNWQFSKTDRFYVADFDGDGKKDLFVFNGQDWSIGYLGMLHSTGLGFSVVQRYDSNMSEWQMKSNDLHYIGDFDGDGKEDLWVFNGIDWSFPYLGMLKSDGTALSMVRKFENTMPNWQMKSNDLHYIGDFDGDGKKDLFVFNGQDWSIGYLGMFKSSGLDLSYIQRYDGNAPGWQMRKNDRHYISDVNGDGKADLFVYNFQDWSREYLGTMISTGTALNSSWSEDWVGEWGLGPSDQFEPCNYEGVAGIRDLFVHKQNWFGMIQYVQGLGRLNLQKLYYNWIHNYRYGRNW